MRHLLRHPNARRPRRPRAFTLIEVLVIVVILGIAALVVVPQLLQAGQLTIQAASRRVVSDILYAQNEAIGRQAAHQVIFDPAGNRYTLADGDGAALTAPWSQGPYVVDFDEDRTFDDVVLVSAEFAGSSQRPAAATASPSPAPRSCSMRSAVLPMSSPMGNTRDVLQNDNTS